MSSSLARAPRTDGDLVVGERPIEAVDQAIDHVLGPVIKIGWGCWRQCATCGHLMSSIGRSDIPAICEVEALERDVVASRQKLARLAAIEAREMAKAADLRPVSPVDR